MCVLTQKRIVWDYEVKSPEWMVYPTSLVFGVGERVCVCVLARIPPHSYCLEDRVGSTTLVRDARYGWKCTLFAAPKPKRVDSPMSNRKRKRKQELCISTYVFWMQRLMPLPYRV